MAGKMSKCLLIQKFSCLTCQTGKDTWNKFRPICLFVTSDYLHEFEYFMQSTYFSPSAMDFYDSECSLLSNLTHWTIAECSFKCIQNELQSRDGQSSVNGTEVFEN